MRYSFKELFIIWIEMLRLECTMEGCGIRACLCRLLHRRKKERLEVELVEKAREISKTYSIEEPTLTARWWASGGITKGEWQKAVALYPIFSTFLHYMS